MKYWYLVMTKPKQDFLAEQNLVQQDYEVYCPKIKVQKIAKGKMTAQVQPLFPRYLFIQLSETEDNWAPIRSTKGVQQLVRFGKNLAKVNADLIKHLQEREQGQINIDHILQQGDKIRVEQGPFYGLEAVFQEYDPDKRIIVLMNFLGQQQRIVLNTEQVSKLS